jgi:hypothetical protein
MYCRQLSCRLISIKSGGGKVAEYGQFLLLARKKIARIENATLHLSKFLKVESGTFWVPGLPIHSQTFPGPFHIDLQVSAEKGPFF